MITITRCRLRFLDSDDVYFVLRLTSSTGEPAASADDCREREVEGVPGRPGT